VDIEETEFKIWMEFIWHRVGFSDGGLMNAVMNIRFPYGEEL
jgi:hypothetical protein